MLYLDFLEFCLVDILNVELNLIVVLQELTKSFHALILEGKKEQYSLVLVNVCLRLVAFFFYLFYLSIQYLKRCAQVINGRIFHRSRN